MMEKNSAGYIISKLPSTAKMYENKKYLVIPVENGLPEYTPEAYNYVNHFFINEVKIPFDIDNCNNAEWNTISSHSVITEIKNICRISYNKDDEEAANSITRIITGKIKESDSAEYKENIDKKTVLDIMFMMEKDRIHIELPYCTIEKICTYEKSK